MRWQVMLISGWCFVFLLKNSTYLLIKMPWVQWLVNLLSLLLLLYSTQISFSGFVSQFRRFSSFWSTIGRDFYWSAEVIVYNLPGDMHENSRRKKLGPTWCADKGQINIIDRMLMLKCTRLCIFFKNYNGRCRDNRNR